MSRQPSGAPKRAYSVVDRVLDVIEVFYAQPEASLTDVAARTGLDPATLLRYLGQLTERGWTERDPLTKRYRLGPQAIALGNAATVARPIRQEARAHMARLVQAYGETANLAMRQGDDLVIVDAVESTQSIKRGAQIGQRDTWHNSSVGKAVLAQLTRSEAEALIGPGPFSRATEHTITDPQQLFDQLAEIRRTGFATDLEEAEVGLRCVGVAIRDADGSPRFALSVSGPATRLTRALIAEIGKELVAVSREVSLADAPGPIDTDRTATAPEPR